MYGCTVQQKHGLKHTLNKVFILKLEETYLWCSSLSNSLSAFPELPV